MKIKDIIKYLKSDYFIVANDVNEYLVEYLHKNQLSESILNSNLEAIEPVVAIKKSVFDSSANDTDFVAAIKIITTNKFVADEVRDEYTQSSQQANNDYSYSANENSQSKSSPFDMFGSFDPSMFASFVTPDMIEKISQSDLFKDMFTPENIKKTLESDQFKSFMQNMDFSDIMNMMNPGSSYSYDDSDDSEYEEYEEFDLSEDDDDEDEYEEIDD